MARPKCLRSVTPYTRAQPRAKTSYATYATSRTLSGMASSLTPGILDRMSEKVRENRLRRMAERQGLRLTKTRRRDRLAFDYGTWGLRDATTDDIVVGDERRKHGYGYTLDEIERYLTRTVDRPLAAAPREEDG